MLGLFWNERRWRDSHVTSLSFKHRDLVLNIHIWCYASGFELHQFSSVPCITTVLNTEKLHYLLSIV